MRIVSGKNRGRKLICPEGNETRPTSDRTREAVFNILAKYIRNLAGTTVLDGFAGSGALGLEALSRGAEKAFFVDSSKNAVKAIKENLSAMKLEAKAVVYSTDMARIPKTDKPCSVVFLDPPYEKGLIVPALVSLEKKGWIDENTVCIAEMERDEEITLPEGFKAMDVRAYGKAKVVFILFR